MGNFRSDNRSRGFGGGRSGGFNQGGRSGGFGGSRGGFGARGRDRDSGFERKSFAKYEVTCAKCGKQTDVPFKPTTGKPVYCRECFGSAGKSSSSFSVNSTPVSRNLNSSGSSNAISQEQFNEINTKLDKILEILENIEFEDDEEADEESEDEGA